jgi:hypothetical protein
MHVGMTQQSHDNAAQELQNLISCDFYLFRQRFFERQPHNIASPNIFKTISACAVWTTWDHGA